MAPPAAAAAGAARSGDLRRRPSHAQPPPEHGPTQSAAKASPRLPRILAEEMEEEEVVLQAGDADDWAYKTEGAANLILTYTGSSPSMLGKVLRVKKVLKDEAEPAPSSEQLLWSELIDSVKQDCLPQAYAQLMSQHLGANHVDGGVRARVSKEFLNIVAKNVLSSRPIGRVHASAIDTTADSALLISDHSLFSGMPSGSSCIAVEIKAKCGFLPSSEYISKENSIKKQVTRYKMHQHLKFHQGQISKTSDYDPLDLFSGSKERIRTAIKSFFSTPQNNFRIFVNGSLGFGGMGGGADTVHPNETDKCLEDLSKVSGLQLSDLIELLSEAILQSGVFDQLLATQKLDDHDIEGAIHLYYSVLSQPCLVCNNITDVELLQKYDALHSLSSEKSCMIVRDFLIAATAKDCSLMMCFRPKECETTDSKYDSVFLKSVNQTYDYKAYFVDLDVKPLDKMPHYFKLDQKIVKFYTKNGEAGGVPCDSSKGGGIASSRVKLSWKGAKQGVTKGGKKRKDEKGVAESFGTTNEKREREMENMDASLLRELQSYSKKGDIHKINLENAKKIATLRSKFMIERQFSIGTLPTFKLNVNCSLEEFESFLEDRRFRFQFLASIYLVNGIVATPPADHITFQLIELTEKLDGEKEAKSILQFVVCEYNNYMGGFRPTPSLDPYEPGGFFSFPKMEFPLPSWFGSVFIMKGHSESYKTLGEVEFTSGLLKVMATRLLKNFSVKNYMKDIPKRQPYLEAPMVLFGEGPRSREILETALGTHLGEFRALLTSSLGSQLRVLMPPGTTTLVHNWSALSKVGLWFFIAIVELQMGLVDEGRVSFRKARQFMRFIIRKMGEAGRVKVDLVLKDTDGVFSLKRLLGYYVTLVNYEEAIVLRLIVRKMLDYRETYDSHGEAKTTKHQELLKAWDLSNAEHFDDHQEWQRWLRIKESNLDLMTSLMI